MRSSRITAAVLALGATMAVIAGCSAEQDSPSSAKAPAQSQGIAKDEAAAPGGGDTAGQQVSATLLDRSLVRTATVEIGSADVVDGARRARGIAATAGGFVAQEDVRDTGAAVTLRVPAAKFDAVLADLGGIGTVRSSTQGTEDVTDQLVDVDSRIATQKASVERVRGLLQRAEAISDVVQIEGELRTREAELDSLERRREALGGQVSLSTITVRLAPLAAPPAAAQESRGFGAGVAAGWNAFVETVRVLLIVLGAVLPFAGLAGLPAAAVLIWLRRRRKAVPVRES